MTPDKAIAECMRISSDVRMGSNVSRVDVISRLKRIVLALDYSSQPAPQTSEEFAERDVYGFLPGEVVPLTLTMDCTPAVSDIGAFVKPFGLSFDDAMLLYTDYLDTLHGGHVEQTSYDSETNQIIFKFFDYTLKEIGYERINTDIQNSLSEGYLNHKIFNVEDIGYFLKKHAIEAC